MTAVYKQDHKLATYAYDNQGRRIQKTVYASDQPTTTRFVYDGARLSAETDANGRPTAEYIYQGHQPVALIKNSHLFAIHSNRRSAPIAVANTKGTIVWQATYSAFGKATVDTDPDGDGKTFTFNLRLPGQYADAETGTYYNIHRDYDPSTGRYLTSDPLGIADGTNTYAYVHSDPMNQIDPLGLFGVDVHYYMVYFLARKAGLDLDTTQIIANASEYVDVNEQTRPIDDPQPFNPNAESLQLYHFTLDEDFSHNGDGGVGYLEYRLKQAGLIRQDFDLAELSPDEQREWYRSHRFLVPQSPQLSTLRRAALTLNKGCQNAKPQLYGEYLHGLADSFAHRDSNNKPYSRKTYPFFPREYIGHGFAGHNPDRTYNHRAEFPTALPLTQWNYNELRTLAAERAIFYKLRQDFKDEINSNASNPAEGQSYVVETDRIWSRLSGAELGKLGYARVGYNSSLPFTDPHPVDPPDHDIGVLQRFNADRQDAKAKAQRLANALQIPKISGFGQGTPEGLHNDPGRDRLSYLGNITDDDLQEQGFTYKDQDDGGKEKPALLLPCGAYRTKVGCASQVPSPSGSP